MVKKNYNIELIRMISFILVIIIHVANYYCRAYGSIRNDEYVFALVLDTFARVSVPCFFMISGALLLGKTDTVHKCVDRIMRFMIVLVFWSLVYYVHNTFYMGTEVKLIEVMYVPMEKHLWYLYAAIPIYLVIPFFQVMCKGVNRALVRWFVVLGSAVMLVMYILGFFGAEFYYDLPILGDRVYTYYFVFGYLLFKWKDNFHLSNRRLMAIFVGSNVLNIIVTTVLTYIKGSHVDKFLEYECPFVIISSFAFFLLVLRFRNGEFVPSEKFGRVIDAICTYSFGIYLIHILFLDNYKKYMEPEDISAWIAVPVLSVVIAALSYGGVWLIRKIPGGKKIT